MIPALRWGRVAESTRLLAWLMPSDDPVFPVCMMALAPVVISTKRGVVHAQSWPHNGKSYDFLIPLDVWCDLDLLTVREYDIDQLVVD